jgi:hypothetical protein
MPGAPRGNTRAPNPQNPARTALSIQEWDELFDGERHLIDLAELTFSGGIGGFRSAVYRQAEKRNGYAKTHRVEATILEVQALNGIPLKRLAPEPATDPTAADSDFEDAWAQAADRADGDLLLGPCTCGQAPSCLPTCARVAAAA